MEGNDSIEARARRSLAIPLDAGRKDEALWEHSLRVANLSERILALPEVPAHRVDRTALRTAAMCHDVGWALQYLGGKVKAWEIHTRPVSEAQRALAVEWMEKQLAGTVQESSLRQAMAAVREFNNRSTRLVEAQVLAEADNLDEIGPLAIWQQVRRSGREGKGLAAMLEVWERQKEYHFWEARIKECFRFGTTRRLAERRLRIMQHCYDSLAEHLGGLDLEEMLSNLEKPARA